MLGTHTHVQTNDARVLAGGTAAITDAGMTGPHDSVIGSDEHGAIKRFLTGMPLRLEPATGDVRIEGALVECGEDGRATACEAVRVPDRGMTQHDEQRDEHQVAREHDAREVEVVRVREVALREPHLREHARGRQQRGRRDAARAADERHERDQPEQVLRREHLAERDERADGRRRVADEAFARRRPARERDPQRRSRRALRRR